MHHAIPSIFNTSCTRAPTFDIAFRLPPSDFLCVADICDLLRDLDLILRHFVPIPGAGYSVEGVGVTADGEPLLII